MHQVRNRIGRCRGEGAATGVRQKLWRQLLAGNANGRLQEMYFYYSLRLSVASTAVSTPRGCAPPACRGQRSLLGPGRHILANDLLLYPSKLLPQEASNAREKDRLSRGRGGAGGQEAEAASEIAGGGRAAAGHSPAGAPYM